MRETLRDYCGRAGKTELLCQWHPSRNGALTPGDLTYGSRQKVWWRCENGHEWRAAVYARTGGAGCPVCAGKQVQAGVNDLASQRPELAAQWHAEKNGGLTPDAVPLGSHRRVWWRCENGHEWQAVVKSRAGGCGCPVCANRVLLPGSNDLAATHPEVARQWHPVKNGRLRPENVAAGTRRKVWWRCDKGHEWQASVVSRASSGAGCPVCAGKKIVPGENDLASSFPAIAGQWCGEKNGGLSPQSVSPYSNRRVWWVCGRGHAWQASVAARTMHGSDCPYCTGRKVLAGFNDLATVEPRLAAQWHRTLNGALTPEMVTVGSHQKVWWECPDGHIWKAVVYARAGPQQCGCPVCAGKVKPRPMERCPAAPREHKNNYSGSCVLNRSI
ncbi:MAG: zinc-ribbon domain-containing protein [Oscillospiraceae bacterium]